VSDYVPIAPIFKKVDRLYPHCPACGKEIRYTYEETDEHSGSDYFKPFDCSCGWWEGGLVRGFNGEPNRDRVYMYNRWLTAEEEKQRQRVNDEREYERLRQKIGKGDNP